MRSFFPSLLIDFSLYSFEYFLLFLLLFHLSNSRKLQRIFLPSQNDWLKINLLLNPFFIHRNFLLIFFFTLRHAWDFCDRTSRRLKTHWEREREKVEQWKGDFQCFNVSLFQCFTAECFECFLLFSTLSLSHSIDYQFLIDGACCSCSENSLFLIRKFIILAGNVKKSSNVKKLTMRMGVENFLKWKIEIKQNLLSDCFSLLFTTQIIFYLIARNFICCCYKKVEG